MFSSTSAVTSSSGTISGNTISNIPAGTNVILTAVLNGCTTTLPVNAPNCNCSPVTAPLGTSKTSCQANAIPSLTVTVNTGDQADWYDAPTGGNLLKTNSLTYMPTTGGTFYVEAINTITSCKSSIRTPISLIINPTPSISIIDVICNGNLLLYDVTLATNGILSTDKGIVNGNKVLDISSGQTVKITSTLNGCTNFINTAKICTCVNLICPELIVTKQ